MLLLSKIYFGILNKTLKIGIYNAEETTVVPEQVTNNIEAFDEEGKSLGVVFETASPFETFFKSDSSTNGPFLTERPTCIPPNYDLFLTINLSDDFLPRVL